MQGTGGTPPPPSTMCGCISTKHEVFGLLQQWGQLGGRESHLASDPICREQMSWRSVPPPAEAAAQPASPGSASLAPAMMSLACIPASPQSMLPHCHGVRGTQSPEYRSEQRPQAQNSDPRGITGFGDRVQEPSPSFTLHHHLLDPSFTVPSSCRSPQTVTCVSYQLLLNRLG